MASYSDSGRRVLVLAIQCHRFAMKIEMSVTKESIPRFLGVSPAIFNSDPFRAITVRLGSRGNTRGFCSRK